MEQRARYFLIVGGLALFIQPGVFLNDEVGQMAALTSLAEGNLLLDGDHPDGYRPYLGGIWVSHGLVPEEGEPPVANAGSSMLNILALPILFVLRGVAAVLGPMGAVGLTVAAAAGGGVWAWRRTRYTPLAVAAGLFAGSMLMQLHWHPPGSPYLEMASLQWVNILFHAFAATLVYDLLRARVKDPVPATVLYAFGTPALFWALNLKYHGIAIALAAIVVWLYQAGHRTDPLRTGLAFAVAGLAVWNHIPNGLLVIIGLGIMAIPALQLGWRPLLARAGAGLAGAVVGLLPEVWDRLAHARLGVEDRFFDFGKATGDPTGAVSTLNEEGRLQWAAWNDPAGPFEAMWQVVFWPDRWTPHVGAALPVLVLIPLLVVVWWAYREGVRGVIGKPLLVWLLVHAAVLLFLFGRGALLNGDAFDFRHTATLWPLLIVPLAGILDSLQVGMKDIRTSGAAVVAGMAALVWAPLLIWRRLNGGSVFWAGTTFEYVDPFRYVGLVGAAFLLGVFLYPRLRHWRRPAAAATVAWSILLQGVIQLGPARTGVREATWPFTAWPMALVEAAVEWFLV